MYLDFELPFEEQKKVMLDKYVHVYIKHLNDKDHFYDLVIEYSNTFLSPDRREKRHFIA